MTTRAALKSEIIADLRRGSSDSTRVLAAISAAIKFYQPQRFFFNESRSVTFDTANGTDTYSFTTIGTEFYRIDSVTATESGQNHSLRPENYAALEELIDSSSTRNRPSCYAYINRGLRFYAVPDAAYTIRVTGHIKLAEPAEDSTADNEWFTEAYELIRCRAKASLSLHVWPDLGLASAMQEGERQARSALRSATTDKIGTGTLVPTQF